MQSAPERIDEKQQIKESEADEIHLPSLAIPLEICAREVVKEVEAEEPPTEGQKDVAPEDAASTAAADRVSQPCFRPKEQSAQPDPVQEEAKPDKARVKNCRSPTTSLQLPWRMSQDSRPSWQTWAFAFSVCQFKFRRMIQT